MTTPTLKIRSVLAENPKGKPRYIKTVINKKGEKVDLADPQVSRALIALMNMHAVIGGAACHWGGPAAFAEIMSSIHGIIFSTTTPWYENFHFVNDAGHTENGIYALRANYHFDSLTFDDLWKFRSIESKLTGHGECHVNPQGVLISNGPLGSSVPVAQGLAMADKVIKNRRTTLCTVSDGALMEGETKESLAAIPGLSQKGKVNPFVLIVSNNNTKLSGRIDQDSFSIEPTLSSLLALGWHVVREKEGHNLQKVFLAVETSIEKAQQANHPPVCLVVDTIKGYGNKETEKSASGGHGFPLKEGDGKIEAFISEIFDHNPPREFIEWARSMMEKVDKKKTAPSSSPSSSQPKEKVQSGIARGMIKAKEEGFPVYSLSADLQGSTGVATFHKKFPDSFAEVGIAESNMINSAIGFSKVGFIPVVDTFAQFGVTKGNLPFAMAQLSQAPVIAVFSHTGFQDAADGASHQATTYFSTTMSIPNTEVISLASAGEAENYMLQAIKKVAKEREQGHEAKNYIFFLGRENYPTHLKENLSYAWGKPMVLTENENGSADLLIVATGPMVELAQIAVKELKENHNVKVKLINNPFVSHPDTQVVGEELKKSQNKLITVEDHQIIGGMGERLAHALLLKGYSFQMKSIGIDGHFGRSAYEAKELYEHFGLGVQKIVSDSLALLKTKKE